MDRPCARIAVFCRQVVNTDAGTITLEGITDTVPFAPKVRTLLYLRIDCSPTEHVLNVQLLQPDGTPQPVLVDTLKGPVVARHALVEFEPMSEGVHRLEIRLDGMMLTVATLNVQR